MIENNGAPITTNGTVGTALTNNAMIGPYQAMLGISGLVLISCLVYLLMGGKRKKKESINI